MFGELDLALRASLLQAGLLGGGRSQSWSDQGFCASRRLQCLDCFEIPGRGIDLSRKERRRKKSSAPKRLLHDLDFSRLRPNFVRKPSGQRPDFFALKRGAIDGSANERRPRRARRPARTGVLAREAVVRRSSVPSAVLSIRGKRPPGAFRVDLPACHRRRLVALPIRLPLFW